MNCSCSNCKSTGRIPCPDCEGNGFLNLGIEDALLDPKAEHYDALLELKQDAQRVISQCAILTKMNPSRAAQYAAALASTLAKINQDAIAVDVMKAKGPA